MRKTALTEEQIIWALQPRSAGVSIHNVCARLGISVATFYNMRKRYSGLELDAIRELRRLEAEKALLVKQLELLKLDQRLLHYLIESRGEENFGARNCSQTA